jgi:hypothetical protein
MHTQSIAISEIIFSYIIQDGCFSTATDKDRRLDLTSKSVTTHRFNNMNLPTSMNPNDYGTVRGSSLLGLFTRYFVINNKRWFEIDVSLDGLTNNVKTLD